MPHISLYLRACDLDRSRQEEVATAGTVIQNPVVALTGFSWSSGSAELCFRQTGGPQKDIYEALEDSSTGFAACSLSTALSTVACFSPIRITFPHGGSHRTTFALA